MSYFAIVGVGSNLGDRPEYIRKAEQLITKSGMVCLKEAPLYTSDPLGPSQYEYINTAFLLTLNESPLASLNKLQKIEDQLGRQRLIKWGDRTIDLDILLLVKDDKPVSLSEERLTVPHPELLHRSFALVPAADICPDWVHPISGLSLQKEVSLRNYSLRKFD